MTPRHTPGGPVLALRALGLGDALTAVPALRALRRRHPGRELLLAAHGAPPALLARLGVVDRVVHTPDPAGTVQDGGPPGAGLGPHLAVNLHGRGPQSTRLLLAGEPEAYLGYADPDGGVPDGPAWWDTEHEVRRWLRLVRHAGGEGREDDLRLPTAGLPTVPVDRRDGGYAVLHPGAASPSRCWPVERWAVVAAALARSGPRVLVTGGTAERDLAAAVVTQTLDAAPGARVASTAGELDLPEMSALLAGADLLLCGDTGVAHLGTAFGTPSVLLFGPVPPAQWEPLADRDRHAVLWHGVGRGDPHGDELDPALSKIDPAEVLAAAETLLAAG